MFLEFLKDQLDIDSKHKTKVTFSTQLRKLIETGLVEGGVPIDFMPGTSLTKRRVEWKKIEKKGLQVMKDESDYFSKYKEYEELLDKLMKYKKDQLLKDAGWSYNEKGKLEGNLQDLLNKVIIPNLERKDITASELDVLEVDDKGDLVFPFGMSVNAESIENILFAVVNKQLVRQKVNGQMLVQISTALFTNNEATPADRNFTNPTDAEIAKWGSSDLPTYSMFDAEGNIRKTISAMKVKIALQGGFIKLLGLTHNDGERIKTRLRLNEMIKDEQWLNRDDNRKLITMVGVRIPVQGLNSAEFMEVYEFLPESAGNIIIPPSEIVSKSGSDFDIDKLTIMMPNIRRNKEGEVILSTEGVRGVENEIMYKMKEILELPHNFISLVRPNSNHLAMDVVDQIRGEEAENISHTKILEIGFNTDIHEAFNVGKKTLGQGAIANTYNALFNRVGMYLMPTFMRDKSEFNTRILLDHNTFKVGKNDVISLSNINNVDGVEIAQILEQLINGWVDVEKDPWIFHLQGNTELTPILLLLVESGVSLTDAVMFLSNPLIKEYVKEQRIMSSSFSMPLGMAPDETQYTRYQAKVNVIARNGFDNYSTLGLDATNTPSVPNILLTAQRRTSNFNPAKLKEIALNGTVNDTARDAFLHFIELELIAGSVRDVKLNTNLDTDPAASLYNVQERRRNMRTINKYGLFPRGPLDRLLTESPISSFASVPDFQEEVWSKYFPLRNHELVNKFLYDFLDTAAGKGAVRTTYGQNEQEKFVAAWKNDLVSFIFQNSIKGFNKNTKEYRSLTVNDKIGVEEVDVLTVGAYVKDNVLYVNKEALNDMFKNKTYADQNKRVRWVQKINKEGKGVKKEWVLSGHALLTPDAFKTRDVLSEKEFYKFIYEREYLRSIISFKEESKKEEFKEKLKRNMNQVDSIETERQEGETDNMYEKRMKLLTYEEILRDKALDNTLNIRNMFYGHNSMVNQFMDIKAKYPSLSRDYPLMESIIQSKAKPGERIKNLKLKETVLDPDTVEVYHENLLELSNPSEIKIDDPEDKLKITNFFQRFNYYAFLQSGLNTKSPLSMTRIIDQRNILLLLKGPYESYIKNLNEEILTLYTNRMITMNRAITKSLNMRSKNYMIDKTLASTMTSEQKVPVKEGIPLKKYKTKDVYIYDAQTSSSKYEVLATQSGGVTFIYNERGKKGRDESLSEFDNSLGIPLINDGKMMTDETLEENKILIDNAIDKIANLMKGNNSIALIKTGYGKELLDNVKSRKTYVHLSSKLYDKFGYINPGSLRSTSIRAIIQKDQPISDYEIQELKNKCLA